MIGVRLFQDANLVVSEMKIEHRDCLIQVMRSSCTDEGSGHNRILQHPRQRDLGHGNAVGFRNVLDGIDHRFIER